MFSALSYCLYLLIYGLGKCVPGGEEYRGSVYHPSEVFKVKGFPPGHYFGSVPLFKVQMYHIFDIFQFGV